MSTTDVLSTIDSLLSKFVGELNDEVTRSLIVSTLAEICKDNLETNTIICDETNNSPDTVDKGELRIEVKGRMIIPLDVV